MRILIVDPSPLARNVYRLILRQMGEWKIAEAEDLAQIAVHQVPEMPDLLVIGERAFQRDEGKFRAVLTDVPSWQHIPKLVIVRKAANDKRSPWHGLARTTIVERPFPPAEFLKAAKGCVKGKG